ncbi:hypothetical protein L798_11954, partial [Zootermopsis nevadensis]
LIDVCVQKLSEKYSPSLATIQMQVHFDTNFASRHDIINDNRASIKFQTAPFIKEIIATYAKTKEDLEKLYRKIVVTTVISSGLGNPTHLNILREATGKTSYFISLITAALSSVFPHTELSQFMALSHKDKEQQIIELTQITTGIRLFNRDCQKGGDGIEDLPNLLQKAITATQSSLESQLQILLERVNILTAAVERCLRPPGKPEREELFGIKYKVLEAESKEGPEQGDNVHTEKLHKISTKQIQMVLDGLATARQLEVYLRKLLMEVEKSQQVLAELLDELKLRLTTIHDTVRFRTAIPTIQIYPQFIHLSEIWTSLQDEMVLLSTINNLAWSLQKYLQVLENIDEGVVKQIIGNTEILTDEARLKATTGLKINSTGLKCEVIYPAQVTEFDKIPLQYLGFCVWSLVEGVGALIPGNPNMGVCQWKENYYAMSSPAMAAEFGQDPEK